MQPNDYQNTTTYPAGGEPYRPYAPYTPPVDPKTAQRRTLRKTANGIGFFVFAYYILMQVIVNVIAIALVNHANITDENEKMYLFFIQIIAAVGASLLAVLFYRLFSRRRFGEHLTKSRVEPSLLLPMVLVGMGGAMLANQLAILFDQNISLFQLENTVSGVTETQSVPEILMYILSTALIPALAEELAFRGVVMNVLRKYGDGVAIIFSSVLFGAMHGNTTQIVFAFILGLIFAYTDCKANSILPSILIHFFNNFYAVSSDIVGSNAGLDDTTITVIRIVIIMMFCVLGVLSYLYLVKRDEAFFRIADSDKTDFYEPGSLTFKEKLITCFTAPGVIVSLVAFSLETILNLIPDNVKQELLRAAGG